MKNRKTASKMLVTMPIILEIASFITFLIYFYSANHAPYNLIGIIYAGPVLSFIGVIISIITRKSRKTYPTLWTSGLLLCSLGFVVCIAIILLLVWIVAAMFNGTWL